jgi:CsoR family transcriptional regulator, copper-sensing transcriptional repressor
MPKGHPNNNSQDRKILHLLKIAKGHLSKVIKMKEDGAYCIDVVHQSLAVQAALKKIDERILEDHLKSCVVDSIKKGDTDKSIKEIMAVLKKK